LQKPSGEIVINNASAQALYKAQKAFAGIAEDKILVSMMKMMYRI